MKLFKNTLLLISVLFMSTLISCDDTIPIEYIHYADENGNDQYPLISEKLDIPNGLALKYDQVFPNYYRRGISTFDNGIATLGRVIFYDENLSHDRTVSCASCHDQKLAFADGKAFSDGVHGRTTSRNSLALGSVFSFREYYGDPTFGGVPFFWDNSANTVQEQSKRTFANEDEMNMNMEQVIERINGEEFYAPLFRAAYGSTEITEDGVLNAISEFVGSMGSYDSPYDKALDEHFATYNQTNNIEDHDFPSFNDAQNKGKKIYLSNCASCHGQINGLPGIIEANNGLDMNYEDTGIEGKSLFKVPTLRNIVLTGPYMHDGRFNTLDEVIDHYSNNIQSHPNLSDDLKQHDGEVKKFNFNAEDKTNLIAFMHTFTDDEFISAERFSDPFK